MHFSDMIHPVKSIDFFQNCFERDVLHISRDDPLYFEQISKNFSFESTLFLSCRKWGDVSLAKAGVPQAECPYIAGNPTLEIARAAFADGYTVVINDLQLKNSEVASLCRSIERTFLCRANVNAYLTKSFTQGLSYHYDDEDVFIFQISGSKSWKIYDAKFMNPMASMPYAGIDCEDQPFRQYLLKAGDVLYLPRGRIHEAVATSESSLHLTVSINSLRWVELIEEAILVIAEQNADFRGTVPVAILAGDDIADLSNLIERLSSALSDEVLIAQALDRIRNRMKSDLLRLPLGNNLKRRVDFDLDLNSVFARAADQICWISPRTAGNFVFHAIGIEIEFPEVFRQMIGFICNAENFSFADFPDCGVSAALRANLVRKLIDTGFLVRLE